MIMANKKGKVGDILMDNIIYLVLLIIFFAGMMAFVYTKMNGAAVWEDFYAKEISKTIDTAQVGDVVILDVQKASEIAKSNKVADFEKIFQFDNAKNEVCVQLSTGGKNCYNYFNNVDIVPAGEGKWIHYAEPVNRLHFAIVARGAKS